MCALFGWLDYKHIVPYKILKKLTQALANAAEERGTDAAGISYIKNGKVTIYKRPKPAHKIRFNAPDGTTAIMGHTRLTTQGNQKFNFNNHPFYGRADKEFSFAHNGVLYNDTELRKSKNLPETHIETVQRNFNFTILDEDNSLYIVKGSNPMFLIHFVEIGLYIYASTQSIMKNDLKKVSMKNIPYAKIETVHGDILKIDSNGFLSRSEFENTDYRFTPWYRYSYDDFEDDYYTQHEQLLFDICNTFGVDEDDAALLLDYGYSSDEIEDMMMDCDLLHSTIQNIKCNNYDDDFLMEV